MKLSLTLALVAMLSVAASAQILTLQSTLQGGNGQKGNMFNVNNISAGPITVTSLDQNFLAAGTSTMEIYTKAGSYAGSETLAANWTLVGSVAGVVHGGAGIAVPIPMTLNVTIPAGTTRGFYVTCTAAAATNVAYTNGNLVLPLPVGAGANGPADANIRFVGGIGNAYPFGATFGGPTPGGVGRCWNGKINYVVGGASAPLWQVNGPAAYLDFDFVLATPVSPAVVNKCVGASVNACADSFGNPADIALNTLPIVSSVAGGFPLSPTIVVNLDLSGGFLWLINSFIPLGAASGTCPVFFNAFPGTLSAQVVALDPTSPIFVSLSQASQCTGLAATGTLTLPSTDDSAYLVDLTASPLCNAAGLNYYGTTYTTIVVSTNGIVFPGVAGNNQWVPSAAQAITQPGAFGVWSDWQADMNPTASIVLTNNVVFGGFDLNFTNVPYWGTAVTSTFRVALDTIGPRLEGLTGLGTDPTTPTMLLMSRGGGTATNAGATAFSLGGTGTTVLNTDMLYALGTGTPTLAGGANNLWFAFNGTGGVDWLGN